MRGKWVTVGEVEFIFSAVRRGIFVASKIKQGFKLRQERNMPPRRGWGIG